jgi:hypothetical protein
MNIYPSTKVLPYVYWCTNRITGEFYIGYHESNSLPSHLDLPKYKTSSEYVKPIFYQFDCHIVAEFFDGDDAFDFEQRLIQENWHDPLILNKQFRLPNGNIRFKSNAHIKVICPHCYESGHPGPMHRHHFANCKSIRKEGFIKPKLEKHTNNISCPHCGLNGQEGAMRRWHFDNCKSLTPIEEKPTILTCIHCGIVGEPSYIKHYHNTRCKSAPSPIPLKKMRKETCPHCNFTGSGAGMTRFHFDNCKSLLPVIEKEKPVCPHCGYSGRGSNMVRFHYEKCKENPTRIETDVTCPHCGDIGAPSQMKRWHFDKCKSNPARVEYIGIEDLYVICPHCDLEGLKGPMHRWHFDNCKLKPL